MLNTKDSHLIDTLGIVVDRWTREGVDLLEGMHRLYEDKNLRHKINIMKKSNNRYFVISGLYTSKEIIYGVCNNRQDLIELMIAFGSPSTGWLIKPNNFASKLGKLLAQPSQMNRLENWELLKIVAHELVLFAPAHLLMHYDPYTSEPRIASCTFLLESCAELQEKYKNQHATDGKTQ